MITAKSPKADIRLYQQTLQQQGLYFGAIDGLWGPKTQRAHEMAEAGKLSASTVSSPAVVRDIARVIIETAASFVDLTETSSNARWDDLVKKKTGRGDLLRAQLIATGWQPGWAYCMSFGEVCWRAGYKGRAELQLIGQSITPSVMSTFENFEELRRITKTPVPGALMLYQHGNTWQGHAAIVEKVAGDVVSTIEGNTSPGIVSDGKDREGDGVWRKTRKIDWTKKSKGLWLRGFVNPFIV